jgi:ABC-type antimicrobial peptide transport system permease subunit
VGRSPYGSGLDGRQYAGNHVDPQFLDTMGMRLVRGRNFRPGEDRLRIALGARASHVVRAILAPMSRPIVIGFVCGALGGSAVASVLRSGIPTMSGLNVFDPLPYVMAMAFFAAVVALSILAPGRRATRINPVQALQHE